jgi:hypothetical protein
VEDNSPPPAPEPIPDATHTAEQDVAAPAPPPAPQSPPASRSSSQSPPAPQSPPGDDGPGHNPLLGPALSVWAFVYDQPMTLVAVPPLAVWHALTRPGTVWDEIDESKVGWVSRIVLVPVIGAWRYATGIRPRLEGAALASRLRGG